MSNHKNKEKNGWAEAIEKKLLPPETQGELIPLSLVIPVYNCSEGIGDTLESIQAQEYSPLEVIVIDAGSTDRTLEIVNSYAELVSRIYTVARFNAADMMNRGISLATGKYVGFVFPGTTYLSQVTYACFAHFVEAHNFPGLIYCGSIQREVKRDPRTIHFPFEKQYLEKGQHPCTLPASWFRLDIFENEGKFNTHLALRFGYEFFCRLEENTHFHAKSIDRIFVDFDYGRFSYGKALRFATETWQIIWIHFGFIKALVWFLSINHLVMLKWIWRRFKQHLFHS